MNYSGVIFDLDGTLLDTLEDLTNAVNYSLSKHGFAERSLEDVRRFVGNGIKNLMKRALPIAATDEEFDECFAAFCEYYGEHANVFTKPYDGVISMLQTLKENGIKTAVVSNKADFAVKKLVKFYFGDLIAVSQGGVDNMRLKPAPDMIELILEKMEMYSDEVVYVGDSEVDIQTAVNSEIPCISVSWGFKDEEFLKLHNAKTIVKNIEELEKILLTNEEV